MMTSGGNPNQNQAVAGIAKKMSYKIFFFSAACCVVAAGVIALLYLVFSLSWAPIAFVNVIFMLGFGLLMMVLDYPAPIPAPALAKTRNHIYKFFLFMTRFTGRGVWYIFLGTMIFFCLWDLKISKFIGFMLGFPVIVLGIACVVVGVQLSNKLNQVRLSLSQGDAHSMCPERGISTVQFGELASKANVNFSKDELDYVINALSESPTNDGIVSPQEYQNWLQPGAQTIV
eukprot:NODE_12856_length_1199_cov_13.673507.p1 GENE.NODE_12856_length_1199_cov_13.673507~~NODE_12856_length_1199_cov_13.673507.p1  ORF type:complete len:230 (-),score=75.87 NODE_12856_length_1199_cov_13.673507:372-1061(-)